LDERKELSRWREKAEWYVCSPSGRYLGVLQWSDVKQIIDLKANAVSATLPRDEYWCRDILFAPDESRVVLVEDSPLVARVIGIEGRELVGRTPLSQPGFVTPELPDAVRHTHAAIVGSCLVVAFDAGIGTYDLSTLHLLHWIPWQGEPVDGIVTDRLGRTMVLETEHAILVAEAWELGHGRVLSVAGRPLELSPDGRRLLVLVDGRCVVWDIEADKAASPVMSHPGDVLSATFSPDGTQVVTGGEEGLIICWQLDG
jgi:WD40 repeat protein